MKLQVNPLCETCLKQKRIEPAVAVDHIVAVKAPGGEAYPALDGLHVVCASCHNRKTRIVEQLGKELTIKGCEKRTARDATLARSQQRAGDDPPTVAASAKFGAASRRRRAEPCRATPH